MNLRDSLKWFLRHRGYEVSRFDALHSEHMRRRKLFKHYGVTRILDVGANEGQYAIELRKNGFKGTIYSFEPLENPFQILHNRSLDDPLWLVARYALGSENKLDSINVSENSQCSSFLEVLPRYTETAPRATGIDQQTVEIKTLDSVFSQVTTPSDEVLLKLDVQGYEQEVLRGAQHSMKSITGIQLEMSLVELYAGELLFDDALDLLAKYGFELSSLDPVYCDPKTGHVLQVDGLFFRRDNDTIMQP